MASPALQGQLLRDTSPHMEHSAHAPGSAGCEVLPSAEGYPEVLRGSHGHLVQLLLCAEGASSTVCSQCPLWVHRAG